MDAGSVIGLLLAWGALLAAFVLEGGHLGGLLNHTAAMIVFGGTLGATMLSVPLRRTLAIPGLMRRVFFPPRSEAAPLIGRLVELAGKARREGVLSLEREIETISDDFTRKAVRLIMDGSDPQVVRDTLEADLRTRSEEDDEGASVFRTMGGYFPTLGIIGTVMGLIHMLAKLDDPGQMGPAIAAAFMATMYGVSFANLVALPFADKLTAQNNEAARLRQIALEGVLGIQAGVNPTALQERLTSFLPHDSAAKRTAAAPAVEPEPVPGEAEAVGGT